MRPAVLLLISCVISFSQIGPVNPGGGGGGSATPGGAPGAVQYNLAGALGGNVLLGAFDPAGGGYLSATLDASGGSPNRCPTWWWGDATCIAPATLLLNQNRTGDLQADNNFEDTGLSIYASYNHTGTGAAQNLMGAEIQVSETGTGPVTYLYGVNQSVYYNGTNVTPLAHLWASSLTGQANGAVTELVGQHVQIASAFGGRVTNEYGFWVTPQQFGDGTTENAYMYYSDDASGHSITNPYYSWYDSRGVRRVKEDNTFDSVGQAIEALYNPQFAKYTAGAANYERVVLGQWNGNVAEIGTEAGGTGTLRPLRLIGDEVQVPSKTFTNLGTPPGNGTVVYCSDCAITSGIDDTCAASGSGASAERVNGVWRCRI